MPGPDEKQKSATPKAGSKPPYKHLLNGVPVRDDEEVHQIGSPPNQMLITVNKKVAAAKAFVAPHVIADAIKDLPKGKQDLIQRAVMECADNPDACNDGFNNEADRHLTVQNNGADGVRFGDPMRQRKEAEGDLKDAQAIIQAEEEREKRLLGEHAQANTSTKQNDAKGREAKKPSYAAPKQ